VGVNIVYKVTAKQGLFELIFIRYDPRFNTWMKIASMNEQRAGFHVSAIPAYNRLYAVGGVNAVGRLSSVECYCVEEDRWKYVASTQVFHNLAALKLY